MKKLIPFFCFIVSVQTAFAQKSNEIRDSLYQFYKQAQIPARQIDLLQQIGSEYDYTGLPDSSRYICEQMLKIATDTNQDSLFATAYLQIGSFFGNISDFKQALEFDFKALAYAEKAKSRSNIWWACKDLGVHYKNLKNYNEALRYLKKSEPF